MGWGYSLAAIIDQGECVLRQGTASVNATINNANAVLGGLASGAGLSTRLRVRNHGLRYI
jgi:hypothetical protein